MNAECFRRKNVETITATKVCLQTKSPSFMKSFKYHGNFFLGQIY